MANPSWKWETKRSFPSQTGAGRAVLEEILDQLRSRQWPAHDVSGVHLALEEALVNAIRHGNGSDERKQVHVCCKLSACHLWIEIRDEGPGFKPCDVPDPTAEENLERPCGRGLLLMRHFMSRVDYNDKGNVVVMEKRSQAGA